MTHRGCASTCTCILTAAWQLCSDTIFVQHVCARFPSFWFVALTAQCEQPAPFNGTMDQSGSLLNDIIFYRCPEGFYLDAAESKIRTCQQDTNINGTVSWSSPDPQCFREWYRLPKVYVHKAYINFPSDSSVLVSVSSKASIHSNLGVTM